MQASQTQTDISEIEREPYEVLTFRVRLSLVRGVHGVSCMVSTEFAFFSAVP